MYLDLGDFFFLMSFFEKFFVTVFPPVNICLHEGAYPGDASFWIPCQGTHCNRTDSPDLQWINFDVLMNVQSQHLMLLISWWKFPSVFRICLPFDDLSIPSLKRRISVPLSNYHTYMIGLMLSGVSCPCLIYPLFWPKCHHLLLLTQTVCFFLSVLVIFQVFQTRSPLAV